MAENKLELPVSLENYNKHGWFICPLCPFDALIYSSNHCPQCGVKLKWDKDLEKINEVKMRSKDLK